MYACCDSLHQLQSEPGVYVMYADNVALTDASVIKHLRVDVLYVAINPTGLCEGAHQPGWYRESPSRPWIEDEKGSFCYGRVASAVSAVVVRRA